jgi:hypothetical protein
MPMHAKSLALDFTIAIQVSRNYNVRELTEQTKQTLSYVGYIRQRKN